MSGTPFADVDTKVKFPALEEEIARWWRERSIVERALAHGDRGRPFVFFEGPPTANGRPGVHHVEARAVKDIVIRYHRMRGEHVVGARGGWDTHGLPVEIEVEKELGFRGKPDIEAYGIAEFNRACKESVRRYIQDWERMTERIAFWIDMERPYSTYDNDYIESLWWILKTLWDRELLFRDYKVTMHCPRCGTSLSDHEVSLGFEDDVDDPSVWVRFRHRPSGHPLDDLLAGAAFLAWTTTPWTLPANAALAVKPGAPYVLVEYRGGGAEERLVVAEPLAAAVLGEGTFEVLERIPGERLGGVAYEPLFTGIARERAGATGHRRPRRRGRLRLAGGRHRHRPHRAGVRGPRHRPEVRAADAAVGGPGRPDAARPGAARLRRPLLQGGRPADHPPPARPRAALPGRARPPRLSVLLALPHARCSTTPSRPGTSARPRGRSGCWPTTSRSTGSPTTSATAASGTGSRTTWTGRSPASGTGAPRCRSGSATAAPGSRSSAPSPSCPSAPGVTSAGSTSTGRTWTRSPGRAGSAGRARCGGCPTSPIAGSTPGRCPWPSGTTRSRTASCSRPRARPTTSRRRSTRPGAGSTPSTRSPRSSSTGRRSRT